MKGVVIGLAAVAGIAAVMFAVAGALIVLAIARTSAGHGSAPAAGHGSEPAAAPGTAAQDAGEMQPLEGADHIRSGQKGHWNNDPPSSGQHYSGAGVAPTSWGYTTADIRPEVWVHNLEHGGVVVLYNCAPDCESDLAAIRTFVRSAPPESHFGEIKLLDAPYPVPGHRYALVAWGWRLFMDTWDPALAARFYKAHVDRAPEDVA